MENEEPACRQAGSEGEQYSIFNAQFSMLNGEMQKINVGQEF
jgi:hypothetical protein